MKKTISITLCFLLVCQYGCHSNQQPARPETKLDQMKREQREMDQAGYPHDSNDDEDDSLGELAVVLVVIVAPFVMIGNAIAAGERTAPAVATHEMNDPYSPDVRRIGTANLVTQWDFAKRPPYTARYKQMAQNDPDYTVRAMAIRALNIARDNSATPIFIAALDDDNELIRLEACKALVNLPDPNAVPGLVRLLDGKREVVIDGRPETVDEGKDVRIAAADALRRYRTITVARELVANLNDRDFGVAWQAHRSLITLTGKDLRYNESAWLGFLVGPEKPFG